MNSLEANNPGPLTPNPQPLTEFEQSLISLGISAATAFSLPKSVGALFGLTFASPQPLALDDYVQRLDISKGSASQGIKFLQRMGAIKPVYLGTRYQGPETWEKGKSNNKPSSLVPRPLSLKKTYYEPEMSLRRLLIGVLNENVIPHLQQGGDVVERLRGQLDEIETAEERELLAYRLGVLEGWGRKGRRLWPVVEKVLSGPLFGSTGKSESS